MKKLKIIKIIATINIFLLSFLTHFIYNIFPNIITSFFFPVNESIFEHMKMIYTTTIIYSIIDYIILKKEKIKFNNFPLQLYLTSILGIITYLIIYLPINYFIKEFLPLSIFILLLVYALMQQLSYYLLTKKQLPLLNKLSILLIIITFIILIFLTHNPPHTPIFYDTSTNTYGTKKTLTKK